MDENQIGPNMNTTPIPCKGPRCSWMYMEEVLWMPRPTRAGRDWFLTPMPTMGLPHGGGSEAQFGR